MQAHIARLFRPYVGIAAHYTKPNRYSRPLLGWMRCRCIRAAGREASPLCVDFDKLRTARESANAEASPAFSLHLLVLHRLCSFAPPSGLPAISPTGGEISRVARFAKSSTSRHKRLRCHAAEIRPGD